MPQTVAKKKPAKGPTAQEFREFIADVYQEWKRLRVGTAWENAEPVWSWDNPVIHGKVGEGAWATAGQDGLPAVKQADHTLLPKYSPDMHSVIELTHAIICKSLQRYINEHRPSPTDTLEMYTEQLQGFLKSQLTAWKVQKMVRRLFSHTLIAILAKDGHYPSKKYR